MFRSLMDRRRWTLLSGVTFGGAALACAVAVWGALLAWFLVATPGDPGFLPRDVQGLGIWALGAAWGLGTPVLGAVLTGVPLWYVLVERLGVDSVETESTWAYPLLGAVTGVGAGVLSPFVMWGSAGVVGAVVSGADLLWLAMLAAVYSLVLAGAVTASVGALAGGVLGYLRQGGDLNLPSFQLAGKWERVA